MTIVKALAYLIGIGVVAGIALTGYFLAFAWAVKRTGKDPSQPWVPLAAVALLVVIAWVAW